MGQDGMGAKAGVDRKVQQSPILVTVIIVHKHCHPHHCYICGNFDICHFLIFITNVPIIASLHYILQTGDISILSKALDCEKYFLTLREIFS